MATDTTERARVCVELREQGWSLQSIAEHLGVHPSTVSTALRHARDSATCTGCGRLTMRGPGVEQCWSCQNTLWPRDRIIQAIRDWHELEGAVPRAWEWAPASARRKGKPEAAARFERDGCWPSMVSVVQRFGSWNAAVEAAGFTPRARVGGPATRREAAGAMGRARVVSGRLIEAGWPPEVASPRRVSDSLIDAALTVLGGEHLAADAIGMDRGGGLVDAITKAITGP